MVPVGIFSTIRLVYSHLCFRLEISFEIDILTTASAMQPSSSEGYSKSMVIYTICRCLVIVLAFWLVYRSTLDFLNSAVDSSIDSIDVPLSEVYFPSVTICNINQVCI